MNSVKAETISGTNEQFSALRDSDDAENTFVAFVTFNQMVFPVFNDGDINNRKPILVPCSNLKDIGDNDYFPSGTTAMRDGVLELIEFFENEAKPIDDVLIIVISDGMENASKRISSEELASRVKELQDAGWNFTYIGANQDLTQVAAETGIHAGNILKWTADSVGTSEAHYTVSNAVRAYTLSRSESVKNGNMDRVSTNCLYSDSTRDEN